MVVIAIRLLGSDYCSDLIQVVEGVHVKAFISNRIMNYSMKPVLHGWLKNVGDTHFLGCEFPKCLGNEFGQDMAPHDRRSSIAVNDSMHYLECFFARDGSVGDVQE